MSGGLQLVPPTASEEMNMPHETTWEPRGICQKFRGTLSSPELLAALAEIQGDDRVKSVRYLIRDFLAVEVFDLGVKALMEGRVWSVMVADQIPDVIVAAVTASPEFIALTKTASSYGLDAYPFALFPSFEEARAWIAEFDSARS